MFLRKGRFIALYSIGNNKLGCFYREGLLTLFVLRSHRIPSSLSNLGTHTATKEEEEEGKSLEAQNKQHCKRDNKSIKRRAPALGSKEKTRRGRDSSNVMRKLRQDRKKK
jgi:hypothetical protein